MTGYSIIKQKESKLYAYLLNVITVSCWSVNLEKKKRTQRHCALAEMEQMKSFKFLGISLMENLS